MVPMTEQLSVDKQFYSTKAYNSLKAYMPLKLHKYGYKLLLIRGDYGFCHNFEIFTTQNNQIQIEKRIRILSRIVIDFEIIFYSSH